MLRPCLRMYTHVSNVYIKQQSVQIVIVSLLTFLRMSDVRNTTGVSGLLTRCTVNILVLFVVEW